MKKSAKVFIILGMVFGFYMIFPIIVGAIALKKLKNAQSKSELTAMSVVTLLFCNIIAGILMLCLPDTEFEQPVVAEAAPAEEPVKEEEKEETL